MNRFIRMFLIPFLVISSSNYIAAVKDEDPEFLGYAREITHEWAEQMIGCSWKPECPVPLMRLRRIFVSHWGYDGRVHQGSMDVHANVATELIEIFRELYEARFPIEKMEPIDHFDADDEKSMTANNSSCFCFRPNVTNPSVISHHGWGIAVDINPLINPYVRGDFVAPANGKDYLDRTQPYIGIITNDPENACHRIFTAHGWKWGGDFEGRIDYQHFYKEVNDVMDDAA